MIRYVGRGLRWTAALHFFVGLWMFADPVLAVLRDGVLAAVDPHLDRQLAFWFLLYSPVLWIFGDGFDYAVASGERSLLRRLHATLLGMGLFGALLMPVSGFWILLVLGILAFAGVQGRAGRDAAGPDGSGTSPISSAGSRRAMREPAL